MRHKIKVNIEDVLTSYGFVLSAASSLMFITGLTLTLTMVKAADISNDASSQLRHILSSQDNFSSQDNCSSVINNIADTWSLSGDNYGIFYILGLILLSAGATVIPINGLFLCAALVYKSYNILDSKRSWDQESRDSYRPRIKELLFELIGWSLEIAGVIVLSTGGAMLFVPIITNYLLKSYSSQIELLANSKTFVKTCHYYAEKMPAVAKNLLKGLDSHQSTYTVLGSAMIFIAAFVLLVARTFVSLGLCKRRVFSLCKACLFKEADQTDDKETHPLLSDDRTDIQI